jgi:hypothetical protein
MKTKINSKLKTVFELGGIHGVIAKPFSKSDLINFVSQFSELRCRRY